MSDETPESIAEKILNKLFEDGDIHQTNYIDFKINDWKFKHIRAVIAEAIRKERVVRVPRKKPEAEISYSSEHQYNDGHNDCLDEIKKLNDGKTFVEGE